MPDKKISALTDGGAIQPGDALVVARGASNVKVLGSAVETPAGAQAKADAAKAASVPLTQRGAANGVATLGADGHVPVSQIGGFLPAPSGSGDAAAITAAIANGGHFVAKPGGAYLVDAPITYTGAADLTLDLTGASFTLSAGVNDRMLYLTGTGRVKIRGGVLDGNRANNTGMPNTGLVEVQGPAYLGVDGVKIVNAAKDGIRAANLSGGRIHAVVDTTGDSAIAVVDSNDVEVSGDIANAGGSGVLVGPYTQDCKRVTVHDCTVRTTATVNTGGIGVYFNSGDVFIVRESSIVNCRVYNAGYVGIFPGGDNITVEGCIVDGSGAVTAASAHAFWSHDSRSHTYTGCVARNAARAGFAIGKAHSIVYAGCIAVKNQQHGFWFPRDDNAQGRYQGTATNKDVTVVGCHAIENGQALANNYNGFYVDGFVNVTYSACAAHDYQATKTQRSGIAAKTNASTAGLKIVNCDLTSNLDANGISIPLGYLDSCYGNKPASNVLIPSELAPPVTTRTLPTAASAHNMDRLLADADLSALTAGTLRLCLIWLPAGASVSSISFLSGGTALSAGTHQWFGLWNFARTSLLGVTSDDGANGWAANTVKTLSLSSAYAVPTSGFYYVGCLVTATTVPTLRGRSGTSTSFGIAPILSGNSTSTGTGLTDPASAPANPTLGPSGVVPYCYVA